MTKDTVAATEDIKVDVGTTEHHNHRLKAQ